MTDVVSTGLYMGRIALLTKFGYGFIDMKSIQRADEGPVEITLAKDPMLHRKRNPRYKEVEPGMLVSFRFTPAPKEGLWDAVGVEPLEARKEPYVRRQKKGRRERQRRQRLLNPI